MIETMSENKARLIVISSVSGGGKTSLIRLLTRKHPELFVAVTATSRKPRVGEVEGVHYYFLSPDEFQARIDHGEFLEHARVHGNYYGIPAAPVEAKLAEGVSVILNIDVQGMRTIKRRMGARVITIFLTPPDETVWESRLRERGTDSEEDIQLRLAQGRAELAQAHDFDYRVENDLLERAAGEVAAILESEGAIRSA
jgi:guanylate kinase